MGGAASPTRPRRSRSRLAALPVIDVHGAVPPAQVRRHLRVGSGLRGLGAVFLPQIRPPMHSFWLLGKKFSNIPAATKALPDLLRQQKPAMAGDLALARIDQAKAVATGKVSYVVEVQLCGPPPARASEPASPTTIPACCPCQPQALIPREHPAASTKLTFAPDEDLFPLNHRVKAAHEIGATKPGLCDLGSRNQPSLPSPGSDVDRRSAFTDAVMNIRVAAQFSISSGAKPFAWFCLQTSVPHEGKTNEIIWETASEFHLSVPACLYGAIARASARL